MAVNATAIISLANAKNRLFEAGTTNDSVIEQMIDHFTQRIEAEVGRPVKKRTVTDKRIDGTGDQWIFIPWTPVFSITQFQVRGNEDDSIVATITDSSKWIMKDPDIGEVKLIYDTFVEGRKNILFTGAVGFETTDIRYKAFEEAMYVALSDLYKRWESKSMSVVQKSFPDGSASFISAADLPPAARQMVAPYRRAMGI